MSSMTFSTDSGNNWSYADTLPVKANITSLLTDGENVYAALYQKGVWRRPIREIVNGIQIDKPHAMPVSYSLKQNYPNPFNPATTITYTLAEENKVSLKVFDILGNDVATLVNRIESGGSHSVSFVANNLPSGIYFYSLRAGSYSETKKMLLLK